MEPINKNTPGQNLIKELQGKLQDKKNHNNIGSLFPKSPALDQMASPSTLKGAPITHTPQPPLFPKPAAIAQNMPQPPLFPKPAAIAQNMPQPPPFPKPAPTAQNTPQPPPFPKPATIAQAIPAPTPLVDSESNKNIFLSMYNALFPVQNPEQIFLCVDPWNPQKKTMTFITEGDHAPFRSITIFPIKATTTTEKIVLSIEPNTDNMNEFRELFKLYSNDLAVGQLSLRSEKDIHTALNYLKKYFSPKDFTFLESTVFKKIV